MNMNEEFVKRLAELMQQKEEAPQSAGPVTVKHVRQVDVLLPREIEGEVVSEEYIQTIDQATGAIEEVTKRYFVKCDNCGQLTRASGRKDRPLSQRLGCGCVVACQSCIEARGGLKVCTECARLICAAHATTYLEAPDVVLCPNCKEYKTFGILGTTILHFLKR